MTRKDIRRGSSLILLLASLCTAVIFTLAYVKQCNERQLSLDADVIKASSWSSNLTNDKSNYSQLDRLDHEINQFIDRWSIKGISLAITRNDSLLYAKGYGWADKENGVRMQPTHIMRVASASKLVTAVVIMKLCEMGKLSLNSKVFGPNGILCDTAYSNAIVDDRMLNITIDHLLRHKAGFGLGSGDPMFNTKDIIAAKHLSTTPTNEELARIVVGRKIAFAPGQGFRYSNFGYMLLSLVIERVTGRDYWDYVTKEVLQPVGCYRFRQATNYYGERYPEEVRYYGPDTVKIEEFNGSGKMVDRVYGGSNVNGLMGAGGWCATASDFARLVASIDKCPKVSDILNPASIDSMTAYSEDEKLSRGWSEIDANGRWSRTGTLSSTHSLIQRFPDGECWVLITNSGVWTGFHFSNEMNRLINRLRSTYSDKLPKRDLFIQSNP